MPDGESSKRTTQQSSNDAPTEPASPGEQRWKKVRAAVQSVGLWKNMAKRTAQALSDNGEPVDAGSLTSFIKGSKFKNDREDAASESQAAVPPKSGICTVTRPSGLPPMHLPMRTSLSLSPRRRVHRLGDQITARCAESPRQGGNLSARCTPLLERCEGHFSHPLRWGSPLASPSPTPLPQHFDDIDSQPASLPVSPQRRWRRELHTPEEDVKRHNTNFTLAITKGFKLRPKDSLHPMLCSVVKAEGEDGKATTLDQQKKTDALAEDEGVHIAERLDKLRSKEHRRGHWTQQAEVTSDRHLLLQESPRPQALASARQLLTDVQFTAAPSSLVTTQTGCGDGSRNVSDFRKFVSLVNSEEGRDLTPDAFMPLMFWFGITQKRRAALAVFQLAFGQVIIPVNWILQLSQHYKVQVQLAEGFHVLARKQSYHHVAEFLTDQKRLREWYSSMTQDVAGRVGVMDVSILLAQLDVPFDKKQLFRYLSSFTEVYNQIHLKPDSTARASEMKNRMNYASFSGLLCRCVITWCINRTLDLVDPPNKAKTDPLENLPSKSAEVTTQEQLEAMADPKTTKRWAEVHRQILVSLLVNHRFWGRESRNVLATMSQPRVLSFGQQLSPEGWLGLFQRVRAQGMASTFPDDDEERDPQFLQKKAFSSVEWPSS